MDGPREIVNRWDVFDGDVLGAMIECNTCEGTGVVVDDDVTEDPVSKCQTCDGDRELHRRYIRPPEGYHYDRKLGWLNSYVESTVDKAEGHSELVDAARPYLRQMFDSAGIEATDEGLDQLGTACRTAGVSYRAALTVINTYQPKADYAE